MKLMLVKDDVVKPQVRQSTNQILSSNGPGIYLSDGHWGLSTSHKEDECGIFGIFGMEISNVIVDMQKMEYYWSTPDKPYSRGLINPRKIELDLSELEAV